jgi:hypothetical protein
LAAWRAGYTPAVQQAQIECSVCHISDQERRLNKCPICFKLACDECGLKAYGRMFCSKLCADQFFFGDDDE